MFLDDKEVSQEIEVPNTEDWNTYSIVKGKTEELAEGEHILKVLLTGAYANLDWIRFIGDGDETSIAEINTDNITYPLSIDVYDMNGKYRGSIIIRSADDEELKQQLRKINLPSGTYLIKGNEYRRIVIHKGI